METSTDLLSPSFILALGLVAVLTIAATLQPLVLDSRALPRGLRWWVEATTVAGSSGLAAAILGGSVALIPADWAPSRLAMATFVVARTARAVKDGDRVAAIVICGLAAAATTTVFAHPVATLMGVAWTFGVCRFASTDAVLVRELAFRKTRWRGGALKALGDVVVNARVAGRAVPVAALAVGPQMVVAGEAPSLLLVVLGLAALTAFAGFVAHVARLDAAGEAMVVAGVGATMALHGSGADPWEVATAVLVWCALVVAWVARQREAPDRLTSLVLPGAGIATLAWLAAGAAPPILRALGEELVPSVVLVLFVATIVNVVRSFWTPASAGERRRLHHRIVGLATVLNLGVTLSLAYAPADSVAFAMLLASWAGLVFTMDVTWATLERLHVVTHGTRALWLGIQVGVAILVAACAIWAVSAQSGAAVLALALTGGQVVSVIMLVRAWNATPPPQREGGDDS